MTNQPLSLSRGAAALGLFSLLFCTGAAPSRPAALGTIKADVPNFTLRLLGDKGAQNVPGKDGIAQVPAGRYWLVGWRTEMKDASGRLWTAVASTFGGATSAQYLTLQPGAAVPVHIGPPLKAVLTADAAGNRVNFQLHFFGAQGERCGEVKVDGALPPKPWLIIRDSEGKVVTRTEFDYGCSFFCHFIWKAPQELKGAYTATAEFDFGPIHVPGTAPAAFELEGVDPDAVAARPGAEAPDFTLKAIEDGEALQLQHMRPNATLLCFFCGCPACADVAKALAAAPAPKPELVAVFSSPELCTPEGAKAFRDQTGFRGAMLADPDARVTTSYDSVTCPRCWVIDSTGMIRYVNGGPDTPAKEILEAGMKHLPR
jgi:peroxiredoxin